MISIQYLKVLRIIYIGDNPRLIVILKTLFNKVIVLNDQSIVSKTTDELNKGAFKVNAILIDTNKWKKNGVVILDNFKKLNIKVPIIALMYPNDLIRLQDTPKIKISICIPTPINIKQLLATIQKETLLQFLENRNNKKNKELAIKGKFTNDLTFGINFNKEDAILNANKYACSILGYRHDELKNNTFLTSIFQSFGKHREMKNAMLKNKKWGGEIEIFSQQMQSIILNVIYTPEFKRKKLHTYTLSGFAITDYVHETTNVKSAVKTTILESKKKENILNRRIKELEHFSENKYQKNIDIGNNALLLSLEKARNKIAEQTTQLYVYEDKIKSLVAQLKKHQKHQLIK
jgi:hypothetical protein